MEKVYKLIQRQRLGPKIWDYSYLLLKNNVEVFSTFKALVNKEHKARILDVGCGFKPWLQMFDKQRVEYIGIDFDKEKSSADFVVSADKFPFSDNDFDALIYSEVLEHAENLKGAIKEMRRVARNNALVYISAPFVFPLHGIPYDFQRLTRYFYQSIFKEDEIVLIRESNSSLSTAFVVFNLFIESTPFSILRGFKHLVYIFNNIIGIAADLVVEIGLKIIKERFKEQFYSMPLGYALVIRIKK
jgi:SAM-dependent methyltransferase